MDFDKAKEVLIANSVGDNEYSHIQTWSELASAADFESQCARDRLRKLAQVESVASAAIEDNSQQE
ncbi:hypothetical protein OCF84_21595 (plasmid) [Shewanella xiamenensis]|uniref:Uncharacterized protein n=1 Tax=Shewanella xiamenensis TaxID=332186 RepID=A0ABT6UF11_9GAMM|nr:hypothetical protein [Shewanella xiamenensis]MDI5832527.1 hypothetical protein [Shewanella xiamenensis]WHF57854.1 hypothetical protein OCF84_21595 [Shewanella xiamenensis]